MGRGTQPRHLAALSCFVFFLALLAWAASDVQAESTLSPAVSTCADCHPEAVSAFMNSFHARAWAAKGMPVTCETCHGPTEAHLNDPSKTTILSFTGDSENAAQARSTACLQCHAATSELALWGMGAHKKNDVACSSCHTIHAPRAQVIQPVTCFKCHKDKKLAANKQSHHPIIEGKVKCSDCHNPHGTMSTAMIREDNINQLCYRCHAEKRGPFIWEHPPVEENCAICHDPHGSRHYKLMKEKIPNLCQDCHDASRHPGTPYDAKAGFGGSAPSNRFLARSCMNCHNMIHGSVAPANPSWGYNSGEFFVR